MVFSWAMFFCQVVTDHCTLTSSADSPLFVCRDHSTPPLFGSKHCMGSAGFRWSYADNVGVLARDEKIVLTFILHVSWQAFRKPISMFTIFPLPEEGPILSVMKCLQPTRIAVERASGYHVFNQSRGRSVRAVTFAVARWSSSTVTSLSWRSAIVVLSQSLTPASSSRGRLTWFPESRSQLCVWSEELWVESYFFSAVIGVFAGSTSASSRMHRNRGSHLRFEKDVASWLRRSVGSQSGRGSREAPGPSVPGRVRSAPPLRMRFWNVQDQTRMLLSDNLALVLALCQGRSICFYTAFSHASYLCVWLQGTFCLIFQVDPV